MRLLDRVARCSAPVMLAVDRDPAQQFEVTSASHYASRVTKCPLRFVLGDDLTRASAELAFADGARLAGCLDLLRIPAPDLWVEWSDDVHQRVICESRSAADYDAAATGRRVGVLLQGPRHGFAAVARTFWVDDSAADRSEVTLSPLETHIDLRGEFAEPCSMPDVLCGGFAGVTDAHDSAMTSLLDHVRFRFDNAWAAYYRSAATSLDQQRHVVHCSLAAVARDMPLLLAFFLLLSAKDATRSIPISRTAINRKRRALGRAPLLDHLEVRASLDAAQSTDTAAAEFVGRQSPRLHHVRGHLVRRDNRVFWRIPHLRGSGKRGMVRSRTVCLSFATHSGGGARTGAQPPRDRQAPHLPI
jgi:hypothetical protein